MKCRKCEARHGLRAVDFEELTFQCVDEAACDKRQEAEEWGGDQAAELARDEKAAEQRETGSPKSRLEEGALLVDEDSYRPLD